MQSFHRPSQALLHHLAVAAILTCCWASTASADLIVMATISPADESGCNAVEQVMRTIVRLEGGSVQFVDYESRRILARIDERSWPLVERLTISPVLYSGCEGWSPPCSEQHIRMYATVTASGRDDFVAALTAAGGVVREENLAIDGIRLWIGVPGDEISTLEERPELIHLRLEGVGSGPGPPEPILYLGEGFPFRVTAEWETEDSFGIAQPRQMTTDTGAFYFFRPDNIELTVKVLDGCALTGHYWVFAAGMTNVGVTLEVSTNSAAKIYTNPLGRAFKTITDTLALPCE